MTALQRSRTGATAFFAINGILGFSFVPRLAEIQSRLGLDAAGLGFVLAVGTAGGLVVGPLAAVLVHRWGAVPVASAVGLLSLPPLVVMGWASIPAVFAVAFFFFWAADAMMDSAMNTRALEVEAVYGRSIINGFHAWWSLGSIIGSALGAGSALVGIALGPFLTGLALLAAAALAMTSPPGRPITSAVAAHSPSCSAPGARCSPPSSWRRSSWRMCPPDGPRSTSPIAWPTPEPGSR